MGTSTFATLPSPRARTRPLTRDPERTRERILAAALREFSARGLAGSRVDRIARRARVNKRMLYHYFGNKDDLYREILGRRLREGAAVVASPPDDPAEMLPYWFDLARRATDWIRLLEWEALEVGGDPVVREAERRRVYGRGVARLRARQARGLFARDLDPRHSLLSMAALAMFPIAFPQITRMMTGLAPSDPAFRRQRTAFLRRFAVAFRPLLTSSRQTGGRAAGARV